MSIRFPKMHIAESVTNRILNAVDDLRGQGIIDVPAQAQAMMPEIPSGTGIKGGAIDAALAAPSPELAAPPDIAGALPGEVARGADLIEQA